MARNAPFVAACALALAACTAPPSQRPPAVAAPAERAAPSVAPRPGDRAPGTPAFVASEVPPGTLYVCVTNVEGTGRQSPIALEPNVQKLCARHPEMGPCQYERDACRRAGGRVFTAGGAEITPATEAEYDSKVLRVRFRAD